MTTEKMKRFLGWVGCTLLVTLAVVPNVLARPNPRITVLFGGSFLRGERVFVVDGDPFISQFLSGESSFTSSGSAQRLLGWSPPGVSIFLLWFVNGS